MYDGPQERDHDAQQKEDETALLLPVLFGVTVGLHQLVHPRFGV